MTDEQVALYLEEHEPSLEAAIISAVEARAARRLDAIAGARAAAGRRTRSRSAARSRTAGASSAIRVRRYSGALGGVLAHRRRRSSCSARAYMRHALSALLVISRSVEAAAPYSIEVTPGHTTIPRGADQPITAKLHGFQADQAVLMIRKSADGRVRARAAHPRPRTSYEGTLFDVAAPIDYFVEALGVRSPVYTLKVADMPYVRSSSWSTTSRPTPACSRARLKTAATSPSCAAPRSGSAPCRR